MKVTNCSGLIHTPPSVSSHSAVGLRGDGLLEVEPLVDQRLDVVARF